MEELFLKTEDGLVPIALEVVQKYGLKKGEKSPFTGFLLVDRNGGFDTQENKQKDELEPPYNNAKMFTTAESIDIAQGVDSQTGGK